MCYPISEIFYASEWIEINSPDTNIYLEVYAENKQAQAFYRGIGRTFTTENPFLVPGPDGKEALSFRVSWDSPLSLKEAIKAKHRHDKQEA